MRQQIIVHADCERPIRFIPVHVFEWQDCNGFSSFSRTDLSIFPSVAIPRKLVQYAEWNSHRQDGDNGAVSQRGFGSTGRIRTEGALDRLVQATNSRDIDDSGVKKGDTHPR